MATEYQLNLKANLDTTQVDSKVKALEAQSSSGKGTASSFSTLEASIKKLNMSIEKLTNVSNKAANGGGGAAGGAKYSNQYMPLLRLAAGHYVGGALLKSGADQVASGNTRFGVASGAVGGALQGAVAGSAFGPVGIAAGAAIGGLNQALGLLVKASERATSQLLEQVKVQQEQIRRFHDAKRTVQQEQELRGFTGLSDEELIRITKELPAAKAALEDFTTGESGKKFAREADPETFIAQRDKRLKELQANIDKATIRSGAAQDILNKRGMISIYGTQGEKASYASLTGLLGTTSSQANVGYDVGGYGGFASIEQNQLAKQTEIASTEKAISETVKQTHVVTTNLYSLLMNRFMGLNGSNNATWGGN